MTGPVCRTCGHPERPDHRWIAGVSPVAQHDWTPIARDEVSGLPGMADAVADIRYFADYFGTSPYFSIGAAALKHNLPPDLLAIAVELAPPDPMRSHIPS